MFSVLFFQALRTPYGVVPTVYFMFLCGHLHFSECGEFYDHVMLCFLYRTTEYGVLCGYHYVVQCRASPIDTILFSLGGNDSKNPEQRLGNK
jgi:hypothetical protein